MGRSTISRLRCVNMIRDRGKYIIQHTPPGAKHPSPSVIDMMHVQFYLSPLRESSDIAKSATILVATYYSLQLSVTA
jgi:hypothetical protein